MSESNLLNGALMNATHFRKLVSASFPWCASITLLLISFAPISPAQTPTETSTQIRDHFQRAQRALQANDPGTAEAEFRSVLALDSKNPGAHVSLGVLEMARGDCRAASDEFHSALAVEPSSAKALALLGICQSRLGESSARASLQKSFEKLQEKPLRVQVGMELVGLYERQGDAEAAGAVMRQLVDLDPDNPDILFAAQRIYSDLADDTLTKLAVVAPRSARMQQAIAEKLINAGDLKGAIDHYRKALQIDPRITGVHYELGEAILEFAHNDVAAQAEAQKELEAAMAAEGDSAKTECELADLAMLQSAPDRALTHYRRAYELNPNDVQADMGLATFAMPDKPQDAIKYLRLAVQSDPLNGSAHYRLARAYSLIGMTDEAQKELQLFGEIKQTKDQVEALYYEMNRRPKADTFGRAETEDSPKKP
jgi:Tfp pilus assembly protein PilF